jgi:hypothetical protein
VSNTWVTYPEDWDNGLKGPLIPDNVSVPHGMLKKGGNPLLDGSASHQLVGKVTAYQGDDG